MLERQVSPRDPRAVDGTTLATIEVAGEEIPNLESFSYSSDVLALSDPFSVVVPDPRGKYKNKLRIGDSVKFYLQNGGLAASVATLKVTGVLTGREATSENGRGTVITIRGADLGWHLVQNDAPIWLNLLGATFDRLLNACIYPHKVFRNKAGKPSEPDPKWGFNGIRLENDRNRRLRQNPRTLAQFFPPLPKANADSKQVATGQTTTGDKTAAASTLPTLLAPYLFIQTEPGQKIADLLVEYARRLGLLVNVSADGYLQTFTPNYSQSAQYRLEYHPWDDPDAVRNNVIRAGVSENAETIWTDVLVVGERVWLPLEDEALRKAHPNVGKFRGRYRPTPSPLPFTHRLSMSEGEAMNTDFAETRARWKQQRGIFDSWTATYEVRGHGQNGIWWESDAMVDVNDTVNGVVGRYYVAKVQCNRTEQAGDRTIVTVKKPDLLGEIPV